MHKNRTFKSVCAIAVSALLVMQNLSPAVSVLADEIKDNDETNGTTIVSVAEPTVAPAESEEVVVVPADETEETVDENVDSVPADDAEPTEVSEDVDTNPPIEQTDVTEPSDETLLMKQSLLKQPRQLKKQLLRQRSPSKRSQKISLSLTSLLKSRSHSPLRSMLIW